VLSLNS